MAREELRSNIRETAERIKDEKEKSYQYQQILINENKSLSQQILSITDMFTKKVQEHDDLKEAATLLEKDKNVLGLELENYKDYKGKYERECDEVAEFQKKWEEINNQLNEKAVEYQQRVDEINDEKDQLLKENKDVRKQLAETEEEVDELRNQVDSLHAVVEQKDAEIEV